MTALFQTYGTRVWKEQKSAFTRKASLNVAAAKSSKSFRCLVSESQGPSSTVRARVCRPVKQRINQCRSSERGRVAVSGNGCPALAATCYKSLVVSGSVACLLAKLSLSSTVASSLWPPVAPVMPAGDLTKPLRARFAHKNNIARVP